MAVEVPVVRWQLSVADYARMQAAGVFGAEDRVELIDGELITMSPIGPGHAGTVKRLIRLLSKSLGDDVIVSAQDPVILNDYSEPQPDIAVLRYRDDFYSGSHPGPGDILLLIEVSDTTYEYDRKVKLLRYARAGVPEVWIVNLEAQQIERFAALAGESYSTEQALVRGEVLEVATGGLTLAVEAVLG